MKSDYDDKDFEGNDTTVESSPLSDDDEESTVVEPSPLSVGEENTVIDPPSDADTAIDTAVEPPTQMSISTEAPSQQTTLVESEPRPVFPTYGSVDLLRDSLLLFREHWRVLLGTQLAAVVVVLAASIGLLSLPTLLAFSTTLASLFKLHNSSLLIPIAVNFLLALTLTALAYGATTAVAARSIVERERRATMRGLPHLASLLPRLTGAVLVALFATSLAGGLSFGVGALFVAPLFVLTLPSIAVENTSLPGAVSSSVSWARRHVLALVGALGLMVVLAALVLAIATMLFIIATYLPFMAAAPGQEGAASLVTAIANAIIYGAAVTLIGGAFTALSLTAYLKRDQVGREVSNA